MLIKIIVGVLILLAALVLTGGTGLHFHRKPKPGEIRVACIGDSITNGCMIPGCFFRSYPAQLQRRLGGGYHVENYGLNDRDLQDTGDKPYRKEAEYRRSIAFRPDIAVILLGTNDSKAANWVSAEAFAEEYRSFLKTYSGLGAKLICCTPPCSFPPKNKLAQLTNDSVPERIWVIRETIRSVCREENIPCMDLYPVFAKHREYLSHDSLHPNANGAAVIAEAAAEMITALKDAETPAV